MLNKLRHHEKMDKFVPFFGESRQKSPLSKRLGPKVLISKWSDPKVELLAAPSIEAAWRKLGRLPFGQSLVNRTKCV